MRIHRVNRHQVPIERFARDTYRAFSEAGIQDLSSDKLLRRTAIEQVELTSWLKNGKLIIKSMPMFFSHSRLPKETEVFGALPKNQNSRLDFNQREKLVQMIETEAEYAMALTEANNITFLSPYRKPKFHSLIRFSPL